MTTKPTVDQVEERLEVLPETLLKPLYSVAVTNLGREIAKAHGLKREDVSFLAEVIAWVFMGFLHTSGVSEAIREYVGVSADVAKAIAQDLDAKLFKTYRADLEKVYTPPGAPITGVGMRISDIAPAPLPVAPSKTPSAGSPAPVPVAVPVKPAPSAIPAPLPAPTAQAPQAPGKANALVPAVVPTPTPTKSATAPAPFIMHQESAATPLAAGSDFKLNISSDLFKSAQAKKVDIPLPPKPAKIEMGNIPAAPKQTPAPSQAVPPTARMVHYTDLRTTLAPGITAMPTASPVVPPPPPVPPQPVAQPPVVPPPPKPPLPIATPAQTPGVSATPATPTGAPIKPKIVNFGPEEVK